VNGRGQAQSLAPDLDNAPEVRAHGTGSEQAEAISKRRWVHRLSNVDVEARTAICAECGPVKVRLKSAGSNGRRRWRCNEYLKDERNTRMRVYRVYKEDTCSSCGFIPDHPVQLDVDHIDGVHDNDDPTNLQTLCANCHRLKTYIQKWKSNRRFSEPIQRRDLLGELLAERWSEKSDAERQATSMVLAGGGLNA
jgi:hypothetical protein